ncbi:MAG: alpha-galactosidase, partial [Kiritimatiellae bacterium]|nr:alpha-galactosidase [Kiritimatiellia bacterium]
AYHESTGGRATHVAFPYFNLVHGDGGTFIALGWAGTWDALYTQTGLATRAVIHSNPRLNTVLLPGETVQTGLVVLLPYAGRDETNAMNLWREWFVRCAMPRANASGAEITPFSTSFYANDTGLPNSDGSISERHFTWKPSLDKVLAEGVAPDFRWFDAGWYFDPAGQTVESDWWGTVGSWELDTEKWPGSSFRDSVDEFHKHGIKTLVWFEPERVTHVDDLAANYGYKKEWAIASGNSITNNIGDPECLEWTASRIIRMMDKNNVDLYREDNNANHNETWRRLDKKHTETTGLPRYGLAENNSIVGHYRLWDKIIDYCRKTGKCTYVDSCASGGGRNDIESLRRGIPFMRSDADRTTTALRLSMSASFNPWIPFHGSATKETDGELDASVGSGSDAYIYRASYLPIFNYGEAFVHNPDLDYDQMRFFIGEWKSIRHLLARDMYVLTPWHTRSDRLGWTAFAYDAPELGDSLLLAFRMEECEEECCAVRLPFAEAGAQYELTNVDTSEKQIASGDDLRQGSLLLTLAEKRSCLMLRLRRI